MIRKYLQIHINVIDNLEISVTYLNFISKYIFIHLNCRITNCRRHTKKLKNNRFLYYRQDFLSKLKIQALFVTNLKM